MDEERRLAQRRAEERIGALLPRPGPRAAAVSVWWLLGLYALFFAAAPYTPTVEEEQRYHDLMGEAVFSEDARQAQLGLRSAQRALDEVHVFGWRWRAPYDRLVPERKRALALATKDFEAAVRERDALMSDAKASVGVWSAYGVEEVRGLFWDAYQSGKDFAKRMTWWDVLLGGVGRRDEELWATLLRWLGQVMMNFTIGLFSALVSFAFSLVSMLWAYKASYLSGLLFFAVAMSGATAMVGLFVGGMYATAVGGVYVLAKSAGNARLEGGRGGGARYVRHDPRFRRDHWD